MSEIRVAVLTVSDGCAAGTREDRSGALLAEWGRAEGRTLVAHLVLPDEVSQITTQLMEWCNGNEVDVVVTTGGTGIATRDVTPEATREVLERELPGIGEALRARGRAALPTADLSRAIAGTRGRTLIVNLPGSVNAVRDGIAVLTPLVPHAVRLLAGQTEH